MLSAFSVSACSQSSSSKSPDLQSPKPEQTNTPMAPDFTATLMTGETVSLSSFAGKTLILNFWATWCGPCRDEIPELNSFYEENKDSVAFLSVEIQESRQEVEEFLRSRPIRYPIVLDSEQGKSISDLYQISVVPTTFIINSKGEIIAKIQGSTTREALSSYLP